MIPVRIPPMRRVDVKFVLVEIIDKLLVGICCKKQLN